MIYCSSFPARACFCTNFARRRAASLPSPKANVVSASQKRSSVAMVIALGSFNRDSGCWQQYSSHFAHIAANSPRMTLTLPARQTAGTVWWRPENTRVPETAPMAVLKNVSYGGRSPSCGTTHGPIADDSMVSKSTLKGQCLSCLQDVKSAFGVSSHSKEI